MVSLVLAINAGSSSVKVSLLFPHGDDDSAPIKLVAAHAERLNTAYSSYSVVFASKIISETLAEDDKRDHKTLRDRALGFTTRRASFHVDSATDRIDFSHMSHEEAIQGILEAIVDHDKRIVSSIAVVGHRVVHGGTKFTESIILDESAIKEIESLSYLAPSNNPVNVAGIRIAQSILPPDVPHVAVFDTSFHFTTMPEVVYQYPLPVQYRESLKIRKYGFHGTSVKYVVGRATDILNRHRGTEEKKWKIVVAHLGEGASVTAVVGGKSVDNTMGFTPLDGLMMGTRCGSIDPSIISYASKKLEKSPEEVMVDLNKKSGLTGISQGVRDMRTILSRHDHDAVLARDMYVYRLAKHIASMMVACGGCIDALVFTAGIGEHSPDIRQAAIEAIAPMAGNAVLDADRNETNGRNSNGIISVEDESGATPAIMVIHTEEEAVICEDCVRLVLQRE